MDTKADRQRWFEHLCHFSSADAKAYAHSERGGSHSIEIFSGNTAAGALHATIRLMEVNQGGGKTPLFTELLLDLESRDEKFAGVLANAALVALRDKLRIGPGVIFENAVRNFFPEHALPHLMLVVPFQWKAGMSEVRLVTGTLYPLVAVPISDRERDFAVAHGARALEKRWADQKVNVLDVSRASAI